MGGVKYAAMRLGRTELANAFHQTTIRHTREMPWVKGYKWYRSRSHAHSDVCDEYANEDHDGLGEGVFKKANVPDKPHPQCLCYIVAVSMDDKDWLKAYNAGRFNQYLGMRVAESGVGEYLTSTFLNKTGQVFGQAAGMVAVSAGYSALERMTRPGGLKNVGFNPVAMKRAMPSARGEMAAAAQAEYYMDDNDPSAWGSADNSHPMAEGNARLERALRSVDNDLAQRQSAFKRLGYTSLEQRWREAYARDAGLTRRRMDSDPTSYMDRHAIDADTPLSSPGTSRAWFESLLQAQWSRTWRRTCTACPPIDT